MALSVEEIYRNPERAGATLAATLETAGLREKRCAVGVPPAWALTASADLPAVSPEDLRGYLEIRAEREFSLPLSEMRLGYSAYTLPDGTSRATLAALPAKRLDAVEKMLAAAGRRAVSISLGVGRSVFRRGTDAAAPAGGWRARRCGCHRRGAGSGSGRGGIANPARAKGTQKRVSTRRRRHPPGRREHGAGRSVCCDWRRQRVQPGGVLPGGAHHAGPGCRPPCRPRCARRISAARRTPPGSYARKRARAWGAWASDRLRNVCPTDARCLP